MIRSLFAAVALIAGVAAVPNPAGPLPDAPNCPVLPADDVWHADVSALPVHAQSAQYVASMGATTAMHADFGSGLYAGGPIGIPYVSVPGTQAGIGVSFTYADESDPGPYPIPDNPPIEGGPQSHGDRHILVVDRDACTLYELYAAYPKANGTWRAGSGAVYDMRSDALRPSGWTSADAAGLPILPGLVRYDEVASGVIDHAIRVTASATQNTFIWPARHQAGDPNTNLPPMGLRLRLKAGFDISGFPPADQVILTALKKYGMILADNGSSWFISGVPDERWDNDVLHALGSLQGSSFEAVDESSLMADPDSGAVVGSQPSISIADRSVAEGSAGAHAVTFALTLSSPSAQSVTVHVATADGTAMAGADYTSVSKTVTFAPGQTTAKVKVSVIGDTSVEPNETFVLDLSAPAGATVADGHAVATITNDD